jgi:uncharacterized protein YggE
LGDHGQSQPHGSPSEPVIEAVDSAKADLSPASASVHITLTGDKFFSSDAAFSKAEELRKLAEALEGHGIPKTALSLTGVTLDVSSGMFTKSSSVTYRVCIRVDDLDLLGNVLDIVSHANKAKLTRLDWKYDDHSSEERQLVRTAGERAAAKARMLAESVGAKLGALHSVREERIAESFGDGAFYGAMASAARSRGGGSVAEEFSGLELAPKRQVTARVAVSYLVESPTAEPAREAGALGSS